MKAENNSDNSISNIDDTSLNEVSSNLALHGSKVAHSEAKNYILVGFVLCIIQIMFSGYSVISVLYVKNIQLDIFFLVFFRGIIAAAAAILLALIIDKKIVFLPRPFYYELGYFAFFGLISTSLNPIMYLQVIRFVSASYVTVLGQLIPIFNTIFSWLLKVEDYPSLKKSKSIFQVVGILIGCAFAISITAIGFTLPKDNVPSINWVYGTIIGVVNNLMFSLYYVLQAKLFYRNPDSVLKGRPFTVNAYSACFGACLYSIGIIPYLILNKDKFYTIPVLGLVPILYSSLLNSTVGFALMTWCVRKASPTIVGTSFSFQVASSILLLWACAGEKMYSSQYGCCVGVVFGVMLVVFAPTLGIFVDKRFKK